LHSLHALRFINTELLFGFLCVQHPFPHGISGSSFDGFEQLNLNVPWSEQRDDGDGVIFPLIPFPPIVVVLIAGGGGGAVFVIVVALFFLLLLRGI